VGCRAIEAAQGTLEAVARERRERIVRQWLPIGAATAEPDGTICTDGVRDRVDADRRASVDPWRHQGGAARRRSKSGP
jgi:hypothetical protein